MLAFNRYQRICKFVLANLRESFAIELAQYKDTSACDHEIAVRLNELQEQHRAFVDKRELFDKELLNNSWIIFHVLSSTVLCDHQVELERVKETHRLDMISLGKFIL